MKANFYKVNLILADGKNMPITIATSDIHRVEPLVEKNKVFYSAKGQVIERFTILETAYGGLMEFEKYQEECAFADIFDEETVDE